MIELEYKTKDEIPAGFESLYTETSGVWKLTGVNGMATAESVTRLQNSLRMERNDHKAAKDKLKDFDFGELTPAQIRESLDRIPELEAAASGSKLDPTQIDKLVEARLVAKTGPLQRRIQELEQANQTATQALATSQEKERTRLISDRVRAEGRTLSMRDTAMADAELLAGNLFTIDEQGNVVGRDDTPVAGLPVNAWLKDMQTQRPHWWPDSEGGGGSGGKTRFSGIEGGNPWSHEAWNLTKQGEIIRRDRALAERAAKAAGVAVAGGRKPEPKKA